MKDRKKCPNCRNKSLVVEAGGFMGENMIGAPLVCNECGYIVLEMRGEEDSENIIKKTPRGRR